MSKMSKFVKLVKKCQKLFKNWVISKKKWPAAEYVVAYDNLESQPTTFLSKENVTTIISVTPHQLQRTTARTLQVKYHHQHQHHHHHHHRTQWWSTMVQNSRSGIQFGTTLNQAWNFGPNKNTTSLTSNLSPTWFIDSMSTLCSSLDTIDNWIHFSEAFFLPRQVMDNLPFLTPFDPCFKTFFPAGHWQHARLTWQLHLCLLCPWQGCQL